jgi:ubiquinone/menaquinone biosynthesis C-methylase UbiE
MSLTFNAREIAAKYDRAARWYDWLEGFLDLAGLGKMRRNLLKRASGKVLEVAVGTGKNLAFYPPDCRIIALDLSAEMLKVARNRGATCRSSLFFVVADAEALPFNERNFDTVVSSLSTCTFPNPASAIREMARVCRPGGKMLLLEHGRSDREWLGRWQDRHADQFAKPLGCHWNREPLELLRRAGIRVEAFKRFFFGVFHRIEAKPDLTQSLDSERKDIIHE